MSKTDYYELLGVSKTVTAEELKKAYRKLAKQFHPDANPGDAKAEAKFKEISEAYDVLKDEQKRAAYDRYGHAAFENGSGGGGGAGFDASQFSDIFGDFFSDFMGSRSGAAGGGRAARARGADLRYNLAVTLEEAFKGKQEKIRFNTAVSCTTCHSTGSAEGAEPATCPTCQGMGKVRAQQGFFTIERTCHTCQGSGKTITNPCRVCSGQGRVRKEKTLSVNIPAGVEEGTRIRLSGEGEVGLRGSPPGDLYIFISLTPHKFFHREEHDIHCEVPVKMTVAALGGTVEVPVIDGTRAKVTIPPGTQSGQQFRLRGKGMSVLQSARRGDMYIHTNIEIPVKLTKKQKELLKEFDNESDNDTQPQSEGFLKKVREFWGELRD